MKNIAVIGAGVAGLVSAVVLASKGHRVCIFEKNDGPGGKMNELETNGFRFDTGPSLLTMPFVLENVFQTIEENIHEYLTLTNISPLCRYVYSDGVVFDSFSDLPLTIQSLNKFAPHEVDNYVKFLSYASGLYKKTADTFLYNPLQSLRDINTRNIPDLLWIDALTTVSKRIDKSFHNNHLRQFFKRFATYNGSSPYLAPATLNVIPFVELCLGGYYVKGGLYEIIKSLRRIAVKKGVSFSYNHEVTTIDVENNTVTGVDGLRFDCVVSNADAYETYINLLPKKNVPALKRSIIKKTEPSCSGFVILLGINRTFDSMVHHNIYFSSDYEREFKQIFKDRVMPEDPTIYVANTSFTDPSHAVPGGSNLFILVNAPYLSAEYDWASQNDRYTDFVINQLERRGLQKLSNHIESLNTITPSDFFEKYRSNKGSIYGTSSNGKLSAFLRPRNKSPYVKNLYLVGGSTHPGGGIPLCILSALNACNQIESGV